MEHLIAFLLILGVIFTFLFFAILGIVVVSYGIKDGLKDFVKTEEFKKIISEVRK